MTLYFVTRHPGAKEWVRDVIDGEPVLLDSLDPKIIVPGDEVCGVLPANLAADVVLRGGIYRHLKLDPLPGVLRGAELSAEQMRQANACLVRYDIRQVAEPKSGVTPGFAAHTKSFLREEGVPLGLFSALLVAAIAPSGVGIAMTEMPRTDAIWAAAGTAVLLLMLMALVRVAKKQSSVFVRFFAGWPGVKALARRGWFVALAPGWSGPALAVAVVCGATLIAGFLVSAVWLEHWKAALFILWELVFVLFFAFAAWLGRGFLGIEIHQLQISLVASRPVVIMFLSPLMGGPGEGALSLVPDENGRFSPTTPDEKPNHTLAHLDAVWSQDGDPMTLEVSTKRGSFPGPSLFPWQQNCRVLNSQFGAERQSGRVVVITSHESTGQFAVFKSTVEHLAQNSQLDLAISELGPINPHSLSDTENALRIAVEDLRNELTPDGTRRWRDEEILIDVTSGPKIASIAAATATFGSDLVFSYVEKEVVWLLDVHARFGQG